eukprot:gene1254-1832_t
MDPQPKRRRKFTEGSVDERPDAQFDPFNPFGNAGSMDAGNEVQSEQRAPPANNATMRQTQGPHTGTGASAPNDSLRKNTSIYITGLPDTVGEFQLKDVCKDHGGVRGVKIYRDEAGRPKGDALVTFKFNKGFDVAENAAKKLDGKSISQGILGDYTIRVAVASFGKKEPVAPAKEVGERETLEDLKGLSIKELRQRLAENAIPCQHCVEKSDLVNLIVEKGAGRIKPKAAPETPTVSAGPTPEAIFAAASEGKNLNEKVSKPPIPDAAKMQALKEKLANAKSNLSKFKLGGNSSAATPNSGSIPAPPKPPAPAETEDEEFERLMKFVTPDVNSLSVKELKQQLKDRAIPFGDCVEKADLRERLKRHLDMEGQK